MPKLSPLRETWPVLTVLKLLHRGKVRDTYELANDLLLIIVTDGISIFDFVLNAMVPDKGRVLLAITHFWMTRLEAHGIRTHMVAAGAAIDAYLPEELRNNPDLQSRAMVVKKLTMQPVEFVARRCLTGTGMKDYLEDGGYVCGHRLPAGLQDGDEIPLIDTPTTKEEEGHDEPLNAATIRQRYPEETRLLMRAFQFISDSAKKEGFIFADTKMEFGVDKEGHVVLGDEVGTPDSSRFWSREEWEAGRKQAERSAPTAYDKELVRQKGKDLGINRCDPRSNNDIDHVHRLEIPADTIQQTTERYRYLFWRLTGCSLEDYFETYLDVCLPRKQKRVAIIFGSESDLGVMKKISFYAREEFLQKTGILESGEGVHILSCHRNPLELIEFVHTRSKDLDAIIAIGGMAFALPGVLDAFLQVSEKDIPVIGVALGAEGSEELDAAKLSISKIPGQTVVMDEASGKTYAGALGIQEVFERILNGELPLRKPRTKKPAQFNIDPQRLLAA